MDKATNVAIVGGSLIGPLAELLLRSVGHTNVTTYEATPEARPQSGGVIGVRETGFDALAQAGVPLHEIVAYPAKDVITYNIDEKMITGLRDHTQYPGETTAWDIFHHAVSRRVDVQYGKRVTGFDPDGVLSFRDGTQAQHDLVIFADGRNSFGRKILDPARKLTYQGYLVWRGITEPVDGVVGFTRYRNDTHGNLYSITEPIIQGVHTGLTDWTYYQNVPEKTFTDLVCKSPTDRVFMLPHHITPPIHAFMCDYAQAYLPDPFVATVENTKEIMAVPINDLSTPSRAVWRRGHTRAVLLGDALMTVRPHSGRGVNNGIDQLWSLVNHLCRHDDLDVALNQWQITIIPQLLEWVDLGRARAQRNGLGIPVLS